MTSEAVSALLNAGAGGAPELGLLYQGAAVRIEEDRGDYVRVSFQAWIAREHLSPQRPATLGRQEAPAPVAREEPQGSPAPLTDLNRAHYVQVDLLEDDAGSLVALLTLATRDGIPVELPENALLAEGFTAEEIKAGFVLYDAVGCDECTEGYKGRTGIYQVMPMSDSIQEIVLEGGNAMQIAEVAQKAGIRDLRQSALMKCRNGVTSLAEINRVTKD